LNVSNNHYRHPHRRVDEVVDEALMKFHFYLLFFLKKGF
jgi:hypothetical protein